MTAFAESLDQVFVTVKHHFIGMLPPVFQPWAAALVSVSATLGAIATLFALTTLAERKLLGRIQNRPGPNRVGPFGLFQPVADGIKAIVKENVVPDSADQIVHFLAPVFMVLPGIVTLSVLPYGRNMVPLELQEGIVFFFAAGSVTELAVFMAGWASHNKYSLLGAMRAMAQMVSYEIPLILSTVPVLLVTASLSLSQIVLDQSASTFGIHHWYLFTPWGFAGFWLFLISGMAEANRAPFDLPEGESEIVAGHLTEYSGFKFALFFMGEYFGLFANTGLAITLYLGGWNAPVTWLDWIPSWIWFFGKLIALIVFFIWVRGTVPRMRMDQLMNFAWKFLLPLALLNVLNASLWRLLGPGILRWVVSALLVVVPYVVLGTLMNRARSIGPRTYRYAE